MVGAAVALMTKALQATGGMLGFSRGSSVWRAVGFACLSMLLLQSQYSILFGLHSLILLAAACARHCRGVLNERRFFADFRGGGGWQGRRSGCYMATVSGPSQYKATRA